jgi:mono/diheme cytochrome c family protein
MPPATPAVAADAPYRVIDGAIDPNTVEGWKIYRGIGTCATCHGPVGQGGVGPALVESLKEKITKDLFVEVVANGRDGTMMKPFGENKIVMDNLDNIYAYLKARSDGVLGPENLIKYPLGKIE